MCPSDWPCTHLHPSAPPPLDSHRGMCCLICESVCIILLPVEGNLLWWAESMLVYIQAKHQTSWLHWSVLCSVMLEMKSNNTHGWLFLACNSVRLEELPISLNLLHLCYFNGNLMSNCLNPVKKNILGNRCCVCVCGLMAHVWRWD